MKEKNIKGFDVISCFLILHHLRDPEGLLRKLRTLLNKKGEFDARFEVGCRRCNRLARRRLRLLRLAACRCGSRHAFTIFIVGIVIAVYFARFIVGVFFAFGASLLIMISNAFVRGAVVALAVTLLLGFGRGGFWLLLRRTALLVCDRGTALRFLCRWCGCCYRTWTCNNRSCYRTARNRDWSGHGTHRSSCDGAAGNCDWSSHRAAWFCWIVGRVLVWYGWSRVTGAIPCNKRKSEDNEGCEKFILHDTLSPCKFAAPDSNPRPKIKNYWVKCL